MLNKKIEDLSLFIERQERVTELYQSRFNSVKRCLFNPVFTIKYFIKYYKRNHWRKYKRDISPDLYTNWISEIESNYSVFECTLPDNYTILKATGIDESRLCLSSVVEAINENPHIDFIYGDEDFLDKKTGLRSNPYFKPDYSPDTLLSFNYIGDFCVLKKELLSPEDMSENIYDIILRASEKALNIHHIKRILFHKTEAYKPSSYEILAKAQRDALIRRGIDATPVPIKDAVGSHILYSVKSEPLVSVIIPSKDHFSVLKKCLDSLFSKTEYKNYEVVLIDNGSNESCKKAIEDYIIGKPVTYIYEPSEFNYSKMCNLGAGRAKGDYLLFLNDDIEICDGGFLTALLGAAMADHVGAVGAKLLYPSGNIIQHDGIIDIAAAPVHALHFGDDSKVYYFGRNRFDFNVAAVTGAALMVSKEKFDRVLGFNEDLAIGFNDIDLCYKLLEKGFYNVLRNDAVLIHHESLSRGNDHKDNKKHKRFLKEKRIFNLSHPGLIFNDGFYHPLLTQTNTDYSLGNEDF